MLSKAQQLQRELIAARVVLRHLHRLGVADAAAGFLRDTALPAGGGQTEFGTFDEAAAGGWRSAVEALHRDADAALPTT